MTANGTPTENPLWSTNDNYAAGSEAWAATPTKVDPGSGPRASGFLPDEMPLPMHHNFLWYAHGKHIDHFRGIEVQNWKQGVDVVTSAAALPILSINWNGTTKKLYFALESDILSSGQGVTWTAESLPGAGPPEFEFIVGDGLMVAGGGAYAGFLTFNGSLAWVLVPVAGTTQYHCATKWNPAGGGFRFMLGAETISAHPAIVTLATNMTTAVSYAPSQPANSTGGITHMASCQTNALSICVAAVGAFTSGGLPWFTSSDAVTWTLQRGTAVTAPLSDLFYDEIRAAFFFIDTAGRVYTSTDGVTITSTGVTAPIDSAKPNTVSAYGALWVGVMSGNRLMWSLDAGVTWVEVFDTFEECAGDQPYASVRTAHVGDRFAVLANPKNTGTKSQGASFSLRLR